VSPFEIALVVLVTAVVSSLLTILVLDRAEASLIASVTRRDP
jgi:hypothetical protein